MTYQEPGRVHAIDLDRICELHAHRRLSWRCLRIQRPLSPLRHQKGKYPKTLRRARFRLYIDIIQCGVHVHRDTSNAICHSIRMVIELQTANDLRAKQYLQRVTESNTLLRYELVYGMCTCRWLPLDLDITKEPANILVSTTSYPLTVRDINSTINM
jgi:hypothetical protein